MQQNFVSFRERMVPLGEDHSLGVEVAVLEKSDQTWVVLRESRKAGQTPVLTACFEYISTCLYTELAVLKGLPLPMRFFHCRYEQLKTSRISWTAKEVVMGMKDHQFHSASWLPVEPQVWGRLNESLNLTESPLKILL